MYHQTSLHPLSPLSPTFSPPNSPGFPSSSNFRSFCLSRRPSLIGNLSSDISASNDGDTSPSCQTRLKIWPGTYVAFALDTGQLEASFEKDSKAQRATREFTPGRYLGLVTASHVYESDEDGEVVNELIVKFATKIAPPHPSDLHWLPISPVSVPELQDSVLRTTLLFPWMDYKQWTTFGVRLRIEQIHASSLVFELEHDDFSRFEDRAGGDHDLFDRSAANANEVGVDRSSFNLGITAFAVPAEVWLDIRTSGEDREPLELANEITFLETIVEGYREDE